MESWNFVPQDKGLILGWDLKTPSSFLGQQNIENDNNQSFEELGFHGMLGKQLTNVDDDDDVVVGTSKIVTSSSSVVMAAPNGFSVREQHHFNSKLSNSLVDTNGCNSLIDLKLGRFGDHGDVIGASFSKGRMSSGSLPPTKRVRSSSGVHSQIAYCQVYGCSKDLSGCKEYHKRHKVCEIHSKTSKVIVNGIEQRFCQQCSRFHLLAEFDDGKRSCRKRLAGHNERRRKPQVGIHSGRAGRLLQPYDSRFQGSMLTSASFICQDILPSEVFSSERCGTSNSWRPIKAEDGTGSGFRPLSSIPITNAQSHSRTLFPSYSDKQFPFLHENAPRSATGSIFCEDNSQYPLILEGSNSRSQSLFQDTSLGSEDFNVFETESNVQGLSGVSDGGCALSLLSSQSQNSSSQSSGIPVPRHLVIPSSHSHYNMSQEVSEKMIGMSSQASSGVSDRFPSELNPTDGNHLSPILISDNNEIVHFEMADRIFQGSDFVNVKDRLSCEDGTTIDLLQLSSQLERVEHQRRALQVKQENGSSCSLRIT